MSIKPHAFISFSQFNERIISKMSLQTLIIFVFLTFLLHSEVFCQPCEEADECIAHDGSPGVIKLASDCQKFLQLSRKIRFMKAPCGYSGTTSLVCCPLPKYVNECNKFGIKPQKELEEDELITFKVTNGRMSDVGEFPHFASLGYRKDDDKYSFDCGGALISEKFVLTAAHCCTRSRVPKIVRLGRVRTKFLRKSKLPGKYFQRLQQIWKIMKILLTIQTSK